MIRGPETKPDRELSPETRQKCLIKAAEAIVAVTTSFPKEVIDGLRMCDSPFIDKILGAKRENDEPTQAKPDDRE